MTHLADRTIAALRAHHDDLAGLVAGGLGEGHLAARSGSPGWTVAQVLSHLGSAAEIGLATLTGADVDNQVVWDRWNALPAEQQAKEFVEHSRAIIEHLESLSPEDRTTRTVDLGFLPEPVPLTTLLGMRLVESVHHTWDVHAAFDLDATLPSDVAPLLAEHYAGGLAFLLGSPARQTSCPSPRRSCSATRATPSRSVRASRVTATPTAPTATFAGPLEAALRLLDGSSRPGVHAERRAGHRQRHPRRPAPGVPGLLTGPRPASGAVGFAICHHFRTVGMSSTAGSALGAARVGRQSREFPARRARMPHRTEPSETRVDLPGDFLCMHTIGTASPFLLPDLWP